MKGVRGEKIRSGGEGGGKMLNVNGTEERGWAIMEQYGLEYGKVRKWELGGGRGDATRPQHH